MSDLPELRFLDEAARAAGWENYRDVSVSVPSHKSVVAHARTLAELTSARKEIERLLVILREVAEDDYSDIEGVRDFARQALKGDTHDR